MFNVKLCLLINIKRYYGLFFIVYLSRHVFGGCKRTLAFIKSRSVSRTVSVVGEAGGADPTLEKERNTQIKQHNNNSNNNNNNNNLAVSYISLASSPVDI